jgi:colanic acid/amylovoran biosynthesis protein
LKIIIVNLHSSKNLGDEAILRSTLYLISKNIKNSQITLVANDPQSWFYFNNCKIIPSFINLSISDLNKFTINFRLMVVLLINLLISFFPLSNRINNRYFDVIKTVKEADLVFSCGGGNFYSNSLLGVPLLLNCLIIIFAGLNKKRIIFLPQSFGPFKKKFHKNYLRAAFYFSEKILVREKKSIDFLDSMNIDFSKTELVPDLAFLLTKLSNYESSDQIVEKPTNLKIGLTIMNRGEQIENFKFQNEYEKSIESFLEEFLKKNNGEIYFFVQCYGPSNDQNDNTISKRIYEKVKQYSARVYLRNHFTNSFDLSNELAKMDLIIATRMHTAIFGLINYVPTITIGYQHKSQGLMNLFNLNEYFISINDINLYSIEEKFYLVLRNKNEIISDLRKQVPYVQRNIVEKFRYII